MCIRDRSHRHMCAGHLGFKKTAEQVQRRAYWVGWRRDVERFCRQCDECNRYYRGRLPRTAPLQPVVTDDGWERLSVDLTGPHPRIRRSSATPVTTAGLQSSPAPVTSDGKRQSSTSTATSSVSRRSPAAAAITAMPATVKSSPLIVRQRPSATRAVVATSS